MTDLTQIEEVAAPVAEPATGAAPDAAALLTITARGIPGPQGSKNHVGGGRMIESSAKVKPWRGSVVDRAVEARSKVRGWRPLVGPVALSMTFTFARPKGHYGSGRNADRVRPSAPDRPDVKPDLDKIVRATKDALTTAGIYRDDAQVVEFRPPFGKWYATDHGLVPDVLDSPGCVIRVWLLGKGE